MTDKIKFEYSFDGIRRASSNGVLDQDYLQYFVAETRKRIYAAGMQAEAIADMREWLPTDPVAGSARVQAAHEYLRAMHRQLQETERFYQRISPVSMAFTELKNLCTQTLHQVGNIKNGLES